jgi:ribonuclease HI
MPISLDGLIAAATRRQIKDAKRNAERLSIAFADALESILRSASGGGDFDRFIEEQTAGRQRDREAAGRGAGMPAGAGGATSSGSWLGWFDGAAEPTNPGNRGIGALLRAPSGETVEISRADGFGTNNEAEYAAIIALLEAAISARAPSVRVFGDSQLVVNQLNGEWDVKSPTLHGLWSRARTLVRKANARVAWVPREQNMLADKLSKKALGNVGPEMEGWGNLTAIGRALGMSAVAVGKHLAALGLKEGRKPTAAACEQGLGRIRQTVFGSECDWHTERLAALLRGISPSAEQ